MNLTINLYDVPLVYTSREDRERLVTLGKSGKCECHDGPFSDKSIGAESAVASDEQHEAYAAKFDRKESDMSWKDLRRVSFY